MIWLISMIWLTVAAGRKPEDEEIHLNSFDRWYTEIAAGAVIRGMACWFYGISVTVIANSLIGTFNSHAVVTDDCHLAHMRNLYNGMVPDQDISAW